MPPRPNLPLRWLLVTLALVLATGCSGCRDHLVGLRDVVLRYAVVGAPPAPDDLYIRVVERLAAAEVGADVETGETGLITVRVDDDFAGETGRLLRWRGGLAVAIVDDAAGPASSVQPRDVVHEQLTSSPAPAGHVLAVEPLEGHLARLRALEWPAVADVASEAAVVDGPRVLVPLTAKAEASLQALATSRPDASVAIVRDRTVAAVVPASRAVRDHRLVVSLGTTIVAYSEAADFARLITSPRLPELRETSHQSLAADWLLAGANLVLPFAMSFAWLFFVRRFDRAQPEPLWLVIATFALGALAVVPAGLLEWGWDSLSPYTNPTLLTFGRSLRAFPVAAVGFIVTVGVSEEATKLFAAWSLATHRREFDEPVDGIVYGAAAALGFAAAENVRYLAIGRVEGALVVSRAFMSVPAHLFFGTIWGYALGRRLVQPKRRVWPLFLLAATLHGLFDTCLSIDGAGLGAFVVGFAAASLFVVHLRLALRYGAVTRPGDSASEAPDLRGAREPFRMGSRRAFAGFVVAMYFFSAVIFFLAIVDHSGRSGVAFGVASALALGLLGWSARGVAASLPLDAVVDDLGVTFAGAAILYRDVVRIERRRIVGSPRRLEQMVIVGDARRLILGPASGDTIDALSHALATRLSSVALRS